MTLIIAHRGFSGKYPENTLIAIKKAAAVGADGVEVDIRATKDGKLVLFHDSILYRLFGKKQRLSATQFSELEQFRIRGTERVPTFEECLHLIKRTAMRYLVVEVKVAGYETQILEAIKKNRLEDRVVVSSKLTSVLRKFRNLDKQARLSYIMDNRPDRLITWKRLNSSLGLYSVHHYHKRPLSTSRFVSTVKKRKVKVMSWFLLKSNVQDSRMARLADLNVDGIITDYPDKLRAILIKKGKHG